MMESPIEVLRISRGARKVELRVRREKPFTSSVS